MKIEVHVFGLEPLVEAINALANSPAKASVVQSTNAEGKEASVVSVETARVPAAVDPEPNQPKSTEETTEEPKPTETCPTPTRSDVSKALKGLADKTSTDKALAFMQSVTGKTKLGDVDPADYGALIDALEKETM